MLKIFKGALYIFFHKSPYILIFKTRGPVAQWVKRWPTDLADLVDPRCWRNLLNRKRSSTAHSLPLSISHRPDMTEILLKKT